MKIKYKRVQGQKKQQGGSWITFLSSSGAKDRVGAQEKLTNTFITIVGPTLDARFKRLDRVENLLTIKGDEGIYGVYLS